MQNMYTISSSCSFPKCVVYLLVILNMVGGILYFAGLLHNPYLYHDNSESSESFLNVMTGLVSINLGLLLLFGALRKDPTFVLIYLILMCLGVIVQTCFAAFSFVTFSVPVKKLTVVAAAIVFEWAAAYCVYLFHRELKDENEKQLPK